MLQPKRHLLFVTGASGGHIYPMLAVLDAVRALDRQVRCSYVGTAADLQAPGIRERTDLEKHAIHSGKLHRYLTLAQFAEFARLSRGFLEARTLIQALQPDAVFAKGSAVSVPIVAAAARLNVPIFSHETDVRSGLSNRFAARFAKTVFTAYPVSNYPNIPLEKLRYVGQPVRSEFYQPAFGDLIAAERLIDSEIPLITVIGGTLGGRGMNALVVAHWADYLQRAQLLHICGSADYQTLAKRAEELPAKLRRRLFLTAYQSEGLPAAFQRSRLVINRSGGTVAELAACAAACILVPLPTAAQNHQRANAAVFAAAGAAEVVQESEGADRLYAVVSKLFDDQVANQALRQAIATFARPQAAQDIASVLLESVRV